MNQTKLAVDAEALRAGSTTLSECQLSVSFVISKFKLLSLQHINANAQDYTCHFANSFENIESHF